MITLDNISYRIGSFNLQASLEIQDEDYFVLAGKTGCGKTTLLECICGLKPVAGGRILVDGVDGRVVQTDTPESMFARPRNAYVARFLRVENVLSGTGLRRDGKSLIHSNGLDIRADAPEGAIEFIVRPWQVDVGETPPTTDKEDNVLEGRIRELSYTGPVARIQVDGPLALVAQVARRQTDGMSLAVGKSVRMSFPADAVYVMENKQG
jgi:ABC-type Fe3+/spermidine/putrescine transport system ATPase subunit